MSDMTPSIGTSPNGGTSKRSRDDAVDLENAFVSHKKVPPYDPALEPAPKSVTSSKDWSTLVEGKRLIYSLLAGPFEDAESEYSTDTTKALVKMVEDCLVTDNSAQIMVSISGLMGTGKSATLNSLFQCGHIARSADEGGSCTLASNQFLRSKKNQEAPFQAEVFFFKPNVQRDILSSYLKDYYRAFHGADEDEDAKPRSGEDKDDLEAVSDEVTTALVSLFREQPSCRTKADVRHFLDGANAEDDPEILRQLFDWCDNLIRRNGGNNFSLTVTASTPGELLAGLTDYITQPDADDGTVAHALWPMVRLVKYHFDDPLTKLGMVFLDTPGLSDLNRTRRLSAIEYNRQKTHAMIVTNASRARDDPNIAGEVRYMNSRGPDRTVIVVTKNEDIGDGTIPTGTKREKDTIKRLRNHHANMVDKVADLENQLAECEEDVQLMTQLTQAKSNYEVHAKVAENAEKTHRIHMRSSQTQTKLQEKLETVTSSTALVRVFPVSNTVYSTHLQGYIPKRTPVLSVEETQIPALRRWLLTAPNEARLNEARHMQNISISSLLSRLLLYTSRTPIERKLDMEVHIRAPLKQFSELITDIFKQFKQSVLGIIVPNSSAADQAWRTKAESLCSQWDDKFASGAFLTLMKRSGHRKGRGANCPIDMSQSLVSLGAAEISASVNRSTHTILNFKSTMETDIEALFGGMVKALSQDANSCFVDLTPFLNFLYSEKPKLGSSIRASEDRLLVGIEDARRKATFAEDDGYIVNAMLPIYEQISMLKNVKVLKGTSKLPMPKGGWPLYRKSAFKKELTSVNGVWAAVAKGMTADIEALVERETQRLTQEIGDVFEDFHSSFDMMCETKHVDNPIEARLQEQLTENLKKAEEHLKGPMQKAYESLWKDFH